LFLSGSFVGVLGFCSGKSVVFPWLVVPFSVGVFHFWLAEIPLGCWFPFSAVGRLVYLPSYSVVISFPCGLVGGFCSGLSGGKTRPANNLWILFQSKALRLFVLMEPAL
jgi:hypothetical protein